VSAHLRIRPAEPREAARCAGFAAWTFVAAYGRFNTTLDLAHHLERTCSVAYFEQLLADPTAALLLAEAGDELAGYVELAEGERPDCVPPGARQVTRFYMAPDWIGKGVSAALMAAAVEEARGRGATALWLTTWEEAHRAIAFYRKSGFREVGTAPFHVGDDVQRDLVLVRPLDPAG
jgi:ribosomal protein S18 acetylase RimI-like enzyme